MSGNTRHRYPELIKSCSWCGETTCPERFQPQGCWIPWYQDPALANDPDVRAIKESVREWESHISPNT